jgi:hypothetical protein
VVVVVVVGGLVVVVGGRVVVVGGRVVVVVVVVVVLVVVVVVVLTVTEIEHVLLPLGPSAIVTDPVPAALPDAVIETDADQAPPPSPTEPLAVALMPDEVPAT